MMLQFKHKLSFVPGGHEWAFQEYLHVFGFANLK